MRRVYLLAGLLLLPLLAQQAVVGQDMLESSTWPAGVVARELLPTERAYNYDFSDIEVSKLESWLKWFGYELPAKFSGKVSGWLWAQRSAEGWFDVAGYRLEGQVDSPQLLIESWKLDQARLRFGYAGGVWYAGSLAGRIAEQASDVAIGQANLVAKLPTTAPQTISISGSVAQVQLQPLLDAFDLNITINNQSGNLVLNCEVPLRSMGDIASWNLNSELDIVGIEFSDAPDVPQFNIASPLKIAAGRWSISGAQCVVAEQILNVDAHGDFAPGESGTLRDASLPYFATFTSDRVDLEKLLSAFRNLPPGDQALQRVDGIASLTGQVIGSVSQGLETAQATMRSPKIAALGEILDDVDLMAMLQITEGSPQGLAIELKSARLAGGLVRGQLAWNDLGQIGQGLPGSAKLNIEQLDLSRLQSNAIPVTAKGALSGIADGQLRLLLEPQQAPLDWSGQLRLRIREFTVAGNALGDVYLSGSKAHLEPLIQLQLRDAQSSFSLQATGSLEPPADGSSVAVQLSSYTVTGLLHDYQSQLALAEQLGPQFASVPFTASGEFKFDAKIENVPLKPTDYWPTTGSVAFDSLSVALSDHTFYLEDSLLNIRPDAFRLERFRLVSKQDLDQIATERQGRLVGSALIRRDAQGEHLLNLLVSDLDIAPYVASFAPQELRGLSGQLQVESRLKKSAESSSWTSRWSGQLAGQLRDVTYRDVPLTELDFSGSVEQELISLHLDGNLLGGELGAKLELPQRQFEMLLNGKGLRQAALDSSGNSSDSGAELAATLQSIKLERLMAMIFGPRMGAKYAGLADFQLNATSGPSGAPQIEATINIPSFFFERRSLAQRLSGAVRYEEGKLSIKQLSGGIAGGRIDVVGSLQNSQSGDLTGDLRFGAQHLQIPAMAAWVAPDKADQFEGRISYSGRALIADEITLNGAAHVRDAVVMKLPIQDVRSQLRVQFSRLGRLHELTARNIHGRALGGMLDGEAHLHGDSSYELSSSIQIGSGKLDQLSRALGFEHIVGTGTFDAQANLRSSDGLNINAIAGPLQIEFRNGDAQSVPILSDLGQLLPVFQLGSTDIRTGRMNAQIGQGQLRIRSVTLLSDAFSVVGDGSASLTSGGLDINALVSTGTSVDRQLAQSASQKLVAVALPQLLLLSELNDLLRNRTIYLHIGGSPSRPILQPQLAPTLGRALLQNVSRQLLLAAPAAAASQKD